MSTVAPKDVLQTEDSSSAYPAPKKILKNTYELVLSAISNDKNIILITGDARKGKTALIHTVCKDISTKNRIISLAGKDLPELDSSGNAGNSELDLMKDFILESTDLEDRLIVTLDDAHSLPLNFLNDLIQHAKKSSAESHRLQLILTAPLIFKDQLLDVENFDDEDLTHYPMDSLSEQEIHNFAMEKSYKISSDIKRLKFKPEALHALSEFIQNDHQLLDVVLEWCAALAKKDQLTSITSNTVSRAAGFARQFSKDKNLRLSNSYPPSHEVYKYINDIQSSKKIKRASTEKSNRRTTKNSKQNKKTKPFIETKNKTAADQVTKIPTITTKVEHKNKKQPATKSADEKVLQSLHEIEDEIIPIQRVPATNMASADKKSFPTMAGLIGLLVVGFITFIAIRIGSDPVVEPIANEQITAVETQNSTEEQAIKSVEPKPTKESNNIDRTKSNKEQLPDQEEVVAVTKPRAGIVASDTKNSSALALQNGELKVAKETINDKVTEKKISAEVEQTNKGQSETKPQNNTEEKVALTMQQDKQVNSKTSPEAEITNLLGLARFQFENKQLSTPAGDNALETYQSILAKHPSNKAAKEGIQIVHDKYISWANYYLKLNDIKRAKHFYNQALKIQPNNSVAIANLQNIAQQETATAAKDTNSVVLQDALPASVIEGLMVTATQKMQLIENGIKENKRNYKMYQEAQTAYQDVLKSQPQNKDAIQGLSLLRKYYVEWAELQIQSKNYNIALFLYGQALSIEPGSAQIAQRIEQIRVLKQAL